MIYYLKNKNLNFIKKINIHNIFWYLLIILVINISFIFRGFIASSDAASSWFNPIYNLKELLYTWSDYSNFGSPSINNFTSFFLRLYYSALSFLSNDPGVLQKISWVVFFSIFGIIIFNIIKKNIINNNLISFFSVLFIFFNPISQYFLWTKQHWAYYLIVPYFIGTFLYIEFCTKKRYFNILLIPLLWFLFGIAFNQPAYFAPYLLIIFILFIFYLFNNKELFKFILFNFILLVIFILVNFVYLLPIINNGYETIISKKNLYGNGQSLPILNDLKNINFFHSFIDIAKNNNNFFINNYNLLFFWTLFFIIIFYVGFINKKILVKKNIFKLYNIFLIIFLIIIFLNKGLSEPFSFISYKIYSMNIMYIFRDFKDKFALAYSCIISIFFIYLFLINNRILKIYLILLSLFCYLLFITNFWIPNNFKYSNNLNYFKSINFNKSGYSKILNLPLVNYSFFYTTYPYYSGDNPMKNIFKKDVIFSTNFSSNENFIYIKNELDNNNLNFNIFYDFLKKYSIGYIINNKNSFVKEDNNPFNYNYKNLIKYNYLKKIYDDKNFELFTFDDYNPIISITNGSFTINNNIKYNISIKGLKNDEYLYFNKLFDRDWSLYLNKINQDKGCKIVKYYKEVDTIECEPEPYIFSLDEIKLIFNNSIFNDKHKKYNELNQWKINPEFIKKNFSKNYYKDNINGGIDLNFTIYYKKQSIFIIGFIVTLFSLFSIFLFLLIKILYGYKK